MANRSKTAAEVALFQLRTEREFLQQAKLKQDQEKDQEWKEGFEPMCSDPDLDVEYMLSAGREVIFSR